MQLLLPVLLVTNILGLASACTQWQIFYRTKSYACELDAGAHRNLCNQMPGKYLIYNADNQGRLGTDITASTFCDPCSQRGQRCYCLVQFWRYSEWISSYIPPFEDNTWRIDSSIPAGRFSEKTVDC
ncbi:hypothetical protein PtrSN002B_011477 [Pyrenophora tritici-repentis]|uniref:Avirulence Effector AvrLm4-7 domain-containing protein n=2 Tax=Pyrenophora tritici-repentis TaxID=45151 RepID=A0A2W1D1W1_9PLEO|nr:uncharacterized protein PTRG_04678 [Pyrenophora tritici-repentis Pt-1C-BFP]KAA8612559.1 hypothetical protein PtrV1_13128 [Pyrenophora tritici-repentis]EDU47585.1 conserved hypothetical protein [Pyrenophora tritici-repentis Pt-1C-BFP]KAF7446906.1 hypothetical protein A1F99_083530 [Pyrenophora tritici-repentis]KAF7569187.1 hypothetical protein PtrM4_116020 [Pyrenophora tritici-repentis]KAG9383023.1 hypothetical protein A1F94_006944 [Pyrenophora tritici-repentis]